MKTFRFLLPAALALALASGLNVASAQAYGQAVNEPAPTPPSSQISDAPFHATQPADPSLSPSSPAPERADPAPTPLSSQVSNAPFHANSPAPRTPGALAAPTTTER